jgi:hypothetical protein
VLTRIQVLSFDHLGMHALFEDPYHIEVVRRDLTRNLVVLFPEVYDEVTQAFQGILVSFRILDISLTELTNYRLRSDDGR